MSSAARSAALRICPTACFCGSPLCTAWELTQAWPDAELVVVGDSGHTGSDAMRQAALAATERFKDLPA